MRNYHFSEKEIEEFLKNNKKAGYGELNHPSPNHEEKFLKKLQLRMKSFVDLTPYFVKVAIVTIIVFLCSMFVWYSFMRPDKSKPIIENIIEQFEKKKMPS
ncbi:MAG: hypothetical protein WC428_01440 [Candidatus Paceibacterota bacterium]|jgi:hypothetical protein